jgi:hypothetical protein
MARQRLQVLCHSHQGWNPQTLEKGTEVNSGRSSGSQKGEMMLLSGGINGEAFNIAGMGLQ